MKKKKSIIPHRGTAVSVTQLSSRLRQQCKYPWDPQLSSTRVCCTFQEITLIKIQGGLEAAGIVQVDEMWLLFPCCKIRWSYSCLVLMTKLDVDMNKGMDCSLNDDYIIIMIIMMMVMMPTVGLSIA